MFWSLFQISCLDWWVGSRRTKYGERSSFTILVLINLYTVSSCSAETCSEKVTLRVLWLFPVEKCEVQVVPDIVSLCRRKKWPPVFMSPWTRCGHSCSHKPLDFTSYFLYNIWSSPLSSIANFKQRCQMSLDHWVTLRLKTRLRYYFFLKK